MRHLLAVFAFITLSVTYLIASPQHGASNMSMMQSCPMKVAGAEVAVTDTTNGVVLNITTKTGDVADLRRRTESMAKMHTEHSNIHSEMMQFDVKYEEISDGARLTLTPKDPAKLGEFRTKVRQHVEQMKTGNCSMMQGMMQGMMPGNTPKPEPKPNAEEDHSAHHPGGENK
jgi:hypothetical protein